MIPEQQNPSERSVSPQQITLPPIEPEPEPPLLTWVFALFVGMLIVLLLAFCGMITALSLASAMSSLPAPQGSPHVLRWTTIHTFAGHGSTRTETFVVPDTWRIVWKCQSAMRQSSANGSFSVAVIGRAGQTLSQGPMSVPCRSPRGTTDTIAVQQGGTVYLEVKTTEEWSLAVQVLA